MRCLHVITGLATGGAEMMLYKLLSAWGKPEEVAVVTLVGGGALQERIETLGVQVVSLGAARGRVPGPRALWRLRRAVRRFDPDLIQGWMYHGNLAAHAAAVSAPSAPVLWNVRSTLATGDEERRTTAAVIRMGARVSRWPARIIYPSSAAANEHEAIGFSSASRVLIGNGFDTERFAPDPAVRAQLRQELGVRNGTVLVGHVARYHRMKDHETLLNAIATLQGTDTPIRLLMAGRGVEEGNATLMRTRERLGLQEVVTLLGERHDLPRLTAAFDIAVSSSAWGEAFPNVLGEAMACGVPCVATDVGDSAPIVGETGRVVPPRTPEALAAAIGDLARMSAADRAALGSRARERVITHYSLPAIVARYRALYGEVTRQRRGAA